MTPEFPLKNNPLDDEPFDDAIEQLDSEEVPDSAGGYKYSGYDALNRPISQRIYSATGVEAEKDLRFAGIKLTSLSPLKIGKKRAHLPKLREMAFLARSIGELTEAGHTPMQICKSLGETETNPTMATALLGVVNALHNGKELHTAFEMQRDVKGRPVFDREFIMAIQIGNSIGSATNQATDKKEAGLLMTLRRYAESKEQAAEIRSSIMMAMIYPSAVVVVAIGAVAIVTIKVMPAMEEFYTALLSDKKDKSLPFITQIMLGISHFIWSYWGLATFVGIAVGLFLFFRWWRSPKGQEFKGRNVIKVPIIGDFFRMLYASQLLRYLSLLCDGLSDIGARFRLAAETTENPVYREMLESQVYLLRSLGSEVTPLFKPYLFLFGRDFLTQLMTADKTGSFAEPFYRYATMLEDRAKRQLKSVLQLMEIVIIVFLALVVGFIVAAIFLPFIELAGKISG
jgi:type IV pilus assembly protein PilC